MFFLLNRYKMKFFNSIILLLSLLISHFSLTQEKQIYVGIDGRIHPYYAFVEIKNDSAIVEILHDIDGGIVRKLYEEKLPLLTSGFDTYRSERIKISNNNSKISFTTIEKDKSTTRVVALDRYLDDVQLIDAQKNKAYYYDKTASDIADLDSLIGKGNYYATEYYLPLEPYRSDDKDLAMNAKMFKDSLNFISDQSRIKIIKRNIDYIQFLKNYLAKDSYSTEEIEQFLKKSSFDKMIETNVLAQIVGKSPDTFFTYLDSTDYLKLNHYLLVEFKDIAYNKLKKADFKKIHKAIKKVDLKSKSKHQIHHQLRKSKTKKVIFRTLPILGYVGIVYLIITYI